MISVVLNRNWEENYFIPTNNMSRISEKLENFPENLQIHEFTASPKE
jgi:hypothetical protein